MQTNSKTFTQLIVNLERKTGDSGDTCLCYFVHVTETFSRWPNSFTAEPSPESHQQGGFTFVRGGFTFKFDKNSTDL